MKRICHVVLLQPSRMEHDRHRQTPNQSADSRQFACSYALPTIPGLPSGRWMRSIVSQHGTEEALIGGSGLSLLLRSGLEDRAPELPASAQGRFPLVLTWFFPRLRFRRGTYHRIWNPGRPPR